MWTHQGRGRDQSGVCTGQETQGCQEPPGAGGGEEGSSPRALRGSKARRTPGFGAWDLRAVRTDISVVLNPPVCGHWLWQPQDTRTRGCGGRAVLHHRRQHRGTGEPHGTCGGGYSRSLTLSSCVPSPASPGQAPAQGVDHCPHLHSPRHSLILTPQCPC